MKIQQKNLLIVGAGPVGLTLACLLYQYGIRCRIIDKRETQSEIHRAIGISHATLRVFENIGIAESVIKDALLIPEIKMFWEGKNIFKVNFKHLKSTYSDFVHLTQPELEKKLIRQLENLGGGVERNTNLLDLNQK